jgi:hypothetical protein
MNKEELRKETSRRLMKGIQERGNTDSIAEFLIGLSEHLVDDHDHVCDASCSALLVVAEYLHSETHEDFVRSYSQPASVRGRTGLLKPISFIN